MFSTRGTSRVLFGGRLKKKRGGAREKEREKKAEKSSARAKTRSATGKREESANAMRHGELLILLDECMFKGLPARVIDGLS